MTNDKPTLESVKEMVTENGFTLSHSAWEDEFLIYAGSVETKPGCYGHPQFEVTFCKRIGWLTSSGHKISKKF